MPRYYCDYCDNYLTHDSVRPLVSRVCSNHVDLTALSPDVIAAMVKFTTLLLSSIFADKRVFPAAIGAEAAQRRLQTQSECTRILPTV